MSVSFCGWIVFKLIYVHTTFNFSDQRKDKTAHHYWHYEMWWCWCCRVWEKKPSNKFHFLYKYIIRSNVKVINHTARYPFFHLKQLKYPSLNCYKLRSGMLFASHSSLLLLIKHSFFFLENNINFDRNMVEEYENKVFFV